MILLDTHVFAETLRPSRDLRRPVCRTAHHRAAEPLLIAAIAHSRGMAVATRNVADFEGCELALVNPWLAADRAKR